MPLSHWVGLSRVVVLAGLVRYKQASASERAVTE